MDTNRSHYNRNLRIAERKMANRRTFKRLGKCLKYAFVFLSVLTFGIIINDNKGGH